MAVVGLVVGLAACVLAAGLGRLLVRRWLPEGWCLWEEWALYGWVGLTALAYCVLAIGLLGFLRWQVLLALVVALAIVAGRSCWALLRVTRRSVAVGRRSAWEWALWGVVGVSVLLAATRAMVPPGTDEWDSLTYHLAAPKLYLDEGRVYRIVHDHHTNSAFNLEMLYTLGLAFGSESMAKSFHFATYLLLLLAIGGAAGRLLGGVNHDGQAAVAVMAFGALPPVVWEAGTAYVDLGVTLGELLAVLALVQWWCNTPSSGRGWLAICGIACGTALATKALGGVVLLFALVAIGARSVLERRADWRGALALVAVAAAVCFPWYLKSYAYTGNPVYPYAYGIFGGADWDEACARNYRADQKSYGFGRVAERAGAGLYRPTSLVSNTGPPAARQTEPAPGPVTSTVNRLFAHGVPTPLIGIPLVPLFATFDGMVLWERPMVIGLIGPLFLAFVPAFWLRRWTFPGIALLPLFALFTLIAWWFTTQLTRYLLPALAVLAIPTAGGVVAVVNASAARSDPLATLTRALVLLCACFSLLPGLITWGDEIPIALGMVPRQVAVGRLFEQAPLFDVANQRFTGAGRIALYGEPRGYYLNVPYMWADYGYHTLFRYEAMSGPDELLNAWRGFGITAVLVNKVYARTTYEGTDTVGRLMRGLIRAGRMVVVDETRTGVLYRVVYEDRRPGDAR